MSDEAKVENPQKADPRYAEKPWPGGKWYKGMPKFPNAGRKKAADDFRKRRLADFVADLEKRYNLVTGDPVEILIYMAAVGVDPVMERDYRKGKITDEKLLYVPLDVRVDAAKAAAPFCRPKLSATQVTGKDEGPIQLETAVSNRLMRDPNYRSMVEQVLIIASTAPDDGEESEELVQ